MTNIHPWISVDERMPEKDVPVLCLQQIYGRRIMVWDGLNWRCDEPGDTLPPYYWMPLPEPPRCPACGYTDEDRAFHFDHHLCSRYPFFPVEVCRESGRDHLPIRSVKPSNDFERDLTAFAKSRPGWTAVQCHCEHCDHFSYTVLREGDYVEFCPRCGLDGYGSTGTPVPMSHPAGASRMSAIPPNPNAMTTAECRSELARRIRSHRISGYRARMQECRKNVAMYNRLLGFPYVARS